MRSRSSTTTSTHRSSATFRFKKSTCFSHVSAESATRSLPPVFVLFASLTFVTAPSALRSRSLSRAAAPWLCRSASSPSWSRCTMTRCSLCTCANASLSSRNWASTARRARSAATRSCSWRKSSALRASSRSNSATCRIASRTSASSIASRSARSSRCRWARSLIARTSTSGVSNYCFSIVSKHVSGAMCSPEFSKGQFTFMRLPEGEIKNSGIYSRSSIVQRHVRHRRPHT
ncbi:hypothetical protein F4779DRAFT_155346 [Xylariaceae sp. FL0662B]|nr:hypothetical protein F4779DRAFT_155346 [Xylariaceae sp. FL0662B]